MYAAETMASGQLLNSNGPTNFNSKAAIPYPKTLGASTGRENVFMDDILELNSQLDEQI